MHVDETGATVILNVKVVDIRDIGCFIFPTLRQQHRRGRLSDLYSDYLLLAA